MPGTSNFLRSQSQPRIFFTLCLLFSLVIVIVTIYFIYFPDKDSLVSNIYNFEQRPPELRSELHGLGRNYEETNHDDTDNSEESEEEPKFRHHKNHHNLKELEQRAHLSNVIESRLLHLDLKGAQPKIPYLKEILKLAKRSGLNGLLLEWEDSFPWVKSLENATMTEGTYTKGEVEEIVNYAELVLDFEVIPLIQTFGHVEFILKGPEYRHLREVDQDPQSFCPSKPGTMALVQEMVDQILQVHKRSRYIHIGCDEVYNLRVCPLCTAATEFKEDLFLKHVISVASYVKKQGRIPIIWDDMLRIVSLKKLLESGIGNLVEPMLWVYAEDVDRFINWESWEKYASVFPTIWGAAAFKGAFGETLSIPPLSRHADNVDRWISVITRESPKWGIGVGGLVLTGWQRYDHFSVLCELLPAGVPSLVYNSLQIAVPYGDAPTIKNRIFVPINESSTESQKLTKRSPSQAKPRPPLILMTSKHSKELQTFDKFNTISQNFMQILQCSSTPTRIDKLLKNQDPSLNFASRCNFPGVSFYRALFRLKPTLSDAYELLEKIERKRGWVKKYNIRHNYSLPLRVDEVVFAEVPRLKRQLELSIRSVENSLRSVFRMEIVLEWIEQNVWEVWKGLDYLEKSGEVLKNVGVWGRRPLGSLREMVEKLRLGRVEEL